VRYLRLGAIPILVIFIFLLGCPKRPVVKPEIPKEEIVAPEETLKVPEETLKVTQPVVEKPALELNRIFFDFDKSDIRPDAAEVLKKNAELLKLYPEAKLIIEGHCCKIGTAEYNMALGERRANSARDYLLMLGITPERLSTISYGEERPLDPNDLPKNRRCEFVVR